MMKLNRLGKIQRTLLILLCFYIVYNFKEFVGIDKESNKVSKVAQESNKVSKVAQESNKVSKVAQESNKVSKVAQKSKKVSKNVLTNAKRLVIQEYYEKGHNRTCNRLKGAKFDFANWMVLLAFNSGAFQLFENWFWHFKRLNLTVPIVAIAEDSSVFKKLYPLRNEYFKVELSSYINISEPLKYNTTLYNVLMSVRPLYKLKYLRQSWNILYADVDAVWLKNPFPNFEGDYEMWMQADSSYYLCAGFIAVKSSEATINMMTKWHEQLKKKSSVNQFIFNYVLRESQVRYKALDKFCFPSGVNYFERFNSEIRTDAVVVHNNYIVGIDKKIDRFKRYKLWKA